MEIQQVDKRSRRDYPSGVEKLRKDADIGAADEAGCYFVRVKFCRRAFQHRTSYAVDDALRFRRRHADHSGAVFAVIVNSALTDVDKTKISGPRPTPMMSTSKK